MITFEKPFQLKSRHSFEASPVLTSVVASARLDALLFELTLRQTYRNPSDKLLEVVYTFPLPPQAVLLGFASELNGQRLTGAIVARKDAEQKYEEALAEGDAPVMLEAAADGLHTANIGNLAPGDEIVLEVRYAQVLAFDQGRLRVAIPMTIAPRYGQPASAGLQPQQVPYASVTVDYPLALSVQIGKGWAGASTECPTHRIRVATEHGESRLELLPGASLDRDVVVIVTPRESRPSLLARASDGQNPAAPLVAMVVLQPPAAAPRERIALKLLVDCSSSMAGDSIASAKTAVRAVVKSLRADDSLSLSRFGSTVEHMLRPTAASARTVRHLLPRIDTIAADLGGTAMHLALNEVFALQGPGAAPADPERDLRRDPEREAGTSAAAADEPGDVLLITDGEVWEIGALVAEAALSRHRIFAIGVGSAPAESVLRRLAIASGGACEFATPGEALEAAVQRMLGRVRQSQWKNVRVDWGVSPAWQVAPPPHFFGGDTLVAYAGFTAPPRTAAVRLLADGPQGEPVELSRCEADVPCDGDVMARMAAAARMASAEGAQALALALDYQLMSARTNCLLVHERAAAEKAMDGAELHRVPSMLAAGWGATSTVGAGFPDAAPMRSFFGSSKYGASQSKGNGMEEIQYPAFQRNAPLFTGASVSRRAVQDSPPVEPSTLAAIARGVVDHLASVGSARGLAGVVGSAPAHPDVQAALDAAIAAGARPDEAWLLLAHWINSRVGGLADADMGPTLDAHCSVIDPALLATCTSLFASLLQGYKNDTWEATRLSRLRRALARL